MIARSVNYFPTRDLRAILCAVEAGPCHARAVRSLSARQRRVARGCALLGWIRLLGPRGPWPRRYVVTASGSHTLGTFDGDGDLHAEIRELRRAGRVAA